MDVFFAGDSAEAKAQVAVFLESLDMRPLDAGGLEMASVLEWAGTPDGPGPQRRRLRHRLGSQRALNMPLALAAQPTSAGAAAEQQLPRRPGQTCSPSLFLTMVE